jgi:hypothetical protein
VGEAGIGAEDVEDGRALAADLQPERVARQSVGRVGQDAREVVREEARVGHAAGDSSGSP